MSYRATLSTGECRSFVSADEAERFIRDHCFRVDKQATKTGAVFTQAVKQQDSSIKIEPAGTIEQVS